MFTDGGQRCIGEKWGRGQSMRARNGIGIVNRNGTDIIDRMEEGIRRDHDRDRTEYVGIGVNRQNGSETGGDHKGQM